MNVARKKLFAFAVSVAMLLMHGIPTAADGLFQKLSADNQPRMVKVFGAAAGRVDGFATGIVVSEEGHILTSQGVFLDGARVNVVLHDGSSHVASVMRRNRVMQVALLKIEHPTPQFFDLSKGDAGEKGDWVMALTNAFRVADQDEPVGAMFGIISLRSKMEIRLDNRQPPAEIDLVLIDAITSNPGAAGGAVINAEGQLVGMVGRLFNSDATNTRMNYAIPVSSLQLFVNEQTAVSAVRGPEAEPDRAESGIVLFRMGGRSDPAYIDRVRRGSPAATAGLQPDDMIVSIGGVKTGNVKEYDAAILTMRAGEETIVLVKRGKTLMRVMMTPEVAK